jgi:hypothetical protein
MAEVIGVAERLKYELAWHCENSSVDNLEVGRFCSWIACLCDHDWGVLVSVYTV